MNARQLRQAAELLKQSDENRRRQFKRMGTEVVQGVEGLVADHILATVREDDDEPIDTDWFASLADQKQRVPIGDGRFIERDRFDSVFIDIDGSHCDFPVKTRGDFRTLCMLLGVKLKEPA